MSQDNQTPGRPELDLAASGGGSGGLPEPGTRLIQLTLVAPASLEETLAEYLLSHPRWGGAFTLLRAEGRGSRGHILTPQEQVRGRVSRAQFQIVLEADAAGTLLDELKQAFPKRDVAYWLTPVIEFGRLG